MLNENILKCIKLTAERHFDSEDDVLNENELKVISYSSINGINTWVVNYCTKVLFVVTENTLIVNDMCKDEIKVNMYVIDDMRRFTKDN